MAKLRIAVAGAGLIGQAHIKLLRGSPSCELAAIVDVVPAAQKLAQNFGVKCFSSLGTLIDQRRPDGIVLATPNQFHMLHALECIHAGIPVLLEKPIAPTVAEAQRIVDAVDTCGAICMIGHHRAHSPIMAKAREIIANGSLGKVVAVMGSALFFKPDHYFAEGSWRTEIGGGPILLNMIHEIHNLRMLCGEIASVQAFTSNATRGYAVEDTAAIILRFASGALGTFILSDTAASAKSWEQTSQENKAYPSYDDEDCLTVAGTMGSLAIPTMRMKSYASEPDRSWWKPFQPSVAAIEREDPLKLQIEHFGAVIREETTPIVTARDGLQNLRVTETIVAAAKSGNLITL